MCTEKVENQIQLKWALVRFFFFKFVDDIVVTDAVQNVIWCRFSSGKQVIDFYKSFFFLCF